jgi:hypothetical protein
MEDNGKEHDLVAMEERKSGTSALRGGGSPGLAILHKPQENQNSGRYEHSYMGVL